MKLTCVCLLMTLLLGCACARGEENSVQAFPLLLSTAMEESTASEIFSTATTRALFTVGMLMDLSLSGMDQEVMDNAAEILFNETYVGQNGNALLMTGYYEGKLLAIIYTPGYGQAFYSLMDVAGGLSGARMMAKAVVADYDWKQNDTDEIASVLQMLNEALGE